MAAANKVKKIKIEYADAAFWAFLLSVLLLPIGFGGNRPLPFGLAQAGLALSCLLLFLGRRNLSPPPLFVRLHLALWLLAIVVTWAWLQTQSFMPVSWIHPLWKETGDVLKQPVHGSIAISPEESLGGLDRFITYIVVGILAYFFGQDPKRGRHMVEGLWISGTVICAYGLIEYIAGGHMVLWFKKWAYEGDLTATFINRNHFAIYAGLALICGAALMMQSMREKVFSQKSHMRLRAMRHWIARDGGSRFFSLLLIVLCIVLSHSRAGLVLSLAGLGVYFVLYQIYRKEFIRAIVAVFLTFIVLAFVVMLARQYSDRFAVLFGDYSSTDRVKVYGLVIQALRDNPWFGYGLDGFQAVFRLYERGMIMEFTHAHSDVLESLLDLGIPVGLMLWLALGLIMSGLARGVVHRRRNGMFPALGLAACVTVLGHSMVDFSLQIPGVVFPWIMLVGCGLAQSWRQHEKQPAHELVE